MEWIDVYKKEFDKILRGLFFVAPDSLDIPENILKESISYAVLTEGKRIRPILGMLCYEACKQRDAISRDVVWKCLASVEMIHAYSLVHDDLPDMDNDERRRGKPTVWKKYGTTTAILVGDALNTLAFENLADHAPEFALRDLMKVLAQGAGNDGMVGGQMRDMYYETKSFDFDQLWETHKKKTGQMIVTSGLMGGCLSRASSEQMEFICRYCEKLGLAFQIKDDLLDIEGDESQMGKAIKKDVQKGCIELLGAEKTKLLLNDLVVEACEVAKKMNSEYLWSLANFVKEREK